MSLAEGSTTADVEAELVDVGEGTADADYAADVKGKIVLASGVPRTVVLHAVEQKGAASVITSWSDGTRSILDIANAVSVEYAPMTVGELEAYVRVFESAGAMKIVEQPARSPSRPKPQGRNVDWCAARA